MKKDKLLEHDQRIERLEKWKTKVEVFMHDTKKHLNELSKELKEISSEQIVTKDIMVKGFRDLKGLMPKDKKWYQDKLMWAIVILFVLGVLAGL